MKIARLPPVPGTVAVYLRVSSRLQRQRETIASQREAVLEHAGSRGWIIPEEQVFADDGFSGATRWQAAGLRSSWSGQWIV